MYLLRFIFLCTCGVPSYQPTHISVASSGVSQTGYVRFADFPELDSLACCGRQRVYSGPQRMVSDRLSPGRHPRSIEKSFRRSSRSGGARGTFVKLLSNFLPLRHEFLPSPTHEYILTLDCQGVVCSLSYSDP